ncbi:unnamed protein product [Vitrella brassicaformis CCMP3155]|uniref:Nitric oxide synthase-interacting protein zinc-finger domain-containing protein n=2 Tax=Vitrella brassicaformis TaxID=1169539 RepID=A0A0G4GHN9_VITBC|nr:unnamed protein product [Vitrella brassicaformis CCMP3155]|eukprot:CEM29215.1 unnamed protein product [Vitrella brassicaformis CCMP3155]
MSRHSKNNTAHSIFTYHEKKMMKDAGTIKERLGTESFRRFESCWLCLQPAVKPVCTPSGYVYCHECIILNLGQQKKDLQRERALWERSTNREQESKVRAEWEAKQMELEQFLQAEEDISASTAYKTNKKAAPTAAPTQASNLNVDPRAPHKQLFVEERKEEARSKNFWIVENTPSAEGKPVKEPRKHLLCPISKKPLKLKELTRINPEYEHGPAAGTSDAPEEGQAADDRPKGERKSTHWLCAVSKKAISHQKAAVIKQTGQVVLMEYLDKYVLGRKGFVPDKEEITSKDIIPLIPGGTGFAAHNKVEVAKWRPVMEA